MESHRDVRCHQFFSKYIRINGMVLVVAGEEAKQRVTAAEDSAVSGLMFADDFVGISEIPEGLQKQIEKALD